MVQIPTQVITLDEFLKLPETKPASEYVDGQILQKPMPQGKHSVIQGEFVPAINQVVKPQRLARAFPELRCTFGDRSIVPDIAVFTWARIPRDEQGEVANTFAAAPDWAIEILSPDQKYLIVALITIGYGISEIAWMGGFYFCMVDIAPV